MHFLLSVAFLLSVSSVGSFHAESEEFLQEYSSGDTFDLSPQSKYNPLVSRDACTQIPLGGVEWILATRQPDYGWKGETHRAVIALAINEWESFSTPDDIRQMELQLEVELTKALLGNSTRAIYPNDLGLYIHALISTNRNPRKFYNADLVERLLHSVTAKHFRVHPFLFLVLCNSNAFPKHHLAHVTSFLRNLLKTEQRTDMLAMTLQAYECLRTLDVPVDSNLIRSVQSRLVARQHLDGSFGNVYTTALVVQALASSIVDLEWNKESAFAYLKSQSNIDVNMVSTYYIQLALNAERVNFIKHIHPTLTLEASSIQKNQQHHFVQYTIRVGKQPDVYFTISLKVAPNEHFYNIMELSAKQDSKFNFSAQLNEDGSPNIFSISGVPNSAEDNLFWRLCLQTAVDHNRHVSKLITIHKSPRALIPIRDDHIIYWYRDSDCEEP